MKFRRKLLALFALLAAGSLFCAPATAQHTGGGTSNPAGGGGNVPTAAPTTHPAPASPSGFNQPVYVSGKVIFEDGSPAGNVPVERACNGTPRPGTYTNGKGTFSFQLDGANTGMTDASMSSGAAAPESAARYEVLHGELGDRGLADCEIRVSLPGFSSNPIRLPGRGATERPEIGAIILRRMANVEGFTISLADATAPKGARKAYESGVKERNAGKLDRALKEFDKAVRLYPRYAGAWYELGMLYGAQSNREKAADCFNRAMEADARFVLPLVPLAAMAYDERKFESTVEHSSRAVAMNPYLPQAFYCRSMAKFRLGDYGVAVQDAERQIQLDTDHRYAKIYHILGAAQANLGDLTGAVRSLNQYLALVPDAQDVEFVRNQIRQVEADARKKDQGQPPPPVSR